MNLPGPFGALFDALAVAGFFANDGRVRPDLSSIAGRSKVKTRLGAHLLLRRVGRVRVHFTGNGLARFRCLASVEFFIGSATAKSHDSAGKESETPAFHSRINNRRILDFQWR
jgi:hypothetical protein